MIVLQTANAPRWETITLPDGVTLRVELTPPAYAQAVRCNMTGDAGERALQFFATVTNWEGVTNERGEPIKYSPDALGLAIRQLEGLFDALLELTRPLFEPIRGAARKNLSAPPSAETPASPPSPSSSESTDSPALPKPSEQPLPN